MPIDGVGLIDGAVGGDAQGVLGHALADAERGEARIARRVCRSC